MSTQPASRSLRDDNRAVSAVIGVVILFGFLIIALSLYQVEVVPQQNAETEFQHSENVRNDLVELRAGILQAGSIDQPQYQTVQLGTSYSTRAFAINPPSPAGTIRTTESYPITISEVDGTGEVTIPTRFIEYRPGYNELGRSSTWYDASVLYFDTRDSGGGVAVIEDQALVDGEEVQITALQNEFRRSGSGQVTLELRPAQRVVGDIPTGEINVTVPTRLNQSDWNTKTDLSSNDVDTNVAPTDTEDIYNLTLETTADDLTVDTVGVQKAPENPTQNNAARIGGDGGDGDDGGDGVDGGDGGDENSPPSVLISDIDVSGPGGSGGATDKARNVAVSFTPDDPDGNLDTASVIVRVGGTQTDVSDPVDISGEEGTTVSVNDLDGEDRRGDVEVTVDVTDTDGQIGSDTKTEAEV